MENKVVTRFAPSPTGFLHIGTYRTAIFSYLYAKKHKGIFVLRIEDTDKERSKKDHEENIIESLEWLGLSYDKFYRQSEQVDRHKFYLEKMIKDGNAYISQEEAKDGSGTIKEIVRFKNPNTDVTFHDEIKGDITMNTKDLGDFVIAKSLDEPLYNFAVVVDDFESGITHIIRGEDHVSNTPRQILIQRAIGAPTPVYAHVPLVLGEDKLKLSKRRGALPVTEYKKLGFLPEAILNGVAFVGWNPGTDKEIFTHDELVEAFDLTRVQKSPAIFSAEKLNWFNKEHIKLLTDSEFIQNAKLYVDPEVKIIKNLTEKEFDNLLLQFKSRITKFSDLNKLIQGSINTTSSSIFSIPNEYMTSNSSSEKKTTIISGPNDYLLPLKDPIIRDVKLLIPKDLKNNVVARYLIKVEELIEKISWEKILEKNDENDLWLYAGEEGRGKVLWPLRVALSGEEKSPDPFEIMKTIGKDSSLRRIKNALKLLNLNIE